MEIKINDKIYRLVLGFEIHVELSTKSKMFCRCPADWFGSKPNTKVCPVCLGFPGALPYPNLQAIEMTYKIALALNCKLNTEFHFDRKHYSYPDLPKGYQITQWNNPIGYDGEFSLFFGKKVRIRRVHLEEDTGKLMHKKGKSLIDFNRSGVPLVEIVTEPDFSDPNDGKEFLEELQRLIRYLEVSDADMEKGSMRLEPNLSLALVAENGKIIFPKYKVEIKNINSFKFVKKAVEYEIKRQAEILQKGKIPAQETRGYNEDKNITLPQRSKEEALDYRYFPEPDIPLIRFSSKKIQQLKNSLPELPLQKRKRFQNEYNIAPEAARILTKDKNTAGLFEKVYKSLIKSKSKKNLQKGLAKKIANFIINKKIKAKNPQDFIKKAETLLQEKKTDIDLVKKVAKKVITENPNAVQDYKNGKKSAVMFLVGKCMQALKGSADAQVVRNILQKEIER